VWAMCAIDALGIPLMAGCDGRVTSTDPSTGTPIRAERRGGNWEWHPDTAVTVVAATGGCATAAEAACRTVNFYQSREHADAYLAAAAGVTGQVLDPAESVAAADLVFGPLLGRPETVPVDADELRGAAFRRLLQAHEPVSAAQLAADLDRPEQDVRDVIDDLATQGRLRVDANGEVVGSAGLSIRPDRHEIDLGGRRFWTWCAYDIIGIFGALRATGRAWSRLSGDGSRVEIRFRDGHPEPTDLVLFLPEDEELASSCTSMYDQWCPNSNLFRSAEAAAAWSSSHHVGGEILTMSQASDRGTRGWLPLAQAPQPSGGGPA
jgi:hypothetical protein